MDIGASIAIGIPTGAFFMSAAAVWITAIKTKATTADIRTKEDGHHSGGLNLGFRCADHSGIQESLKNLAAGQERIEQAQEKIFDLLREKT